MTANNSGTVINAKRVTLSLIKRLGGITFHRSTLWQGKINEKKGALKISEYCFLYFAVPENISTAILFLNVA